MTERRCLCGCGEIVRGHGSYVDKAHKQKAYRDRASRNAEIVDNRNASRNTAPVTQNEAVTVEDTPQALRAEATRLVELQRKHRGTRPFKGLDGREVQVIGHYKPTAESEARAQMILQLRKRAAKLETSGRVLPSSVVPSPENT